MVQIIHFFEKKFKLYMVFAYIFSKPYISKICNGFSLCVCVCVCVCIYNLIGFRLFNFCTQ